MVVPEEAVVVRVVIQGHRKNLTKAKNVRMECGESDAVSREEMSKPTAPILLRSLPQALDNPLRKPPLPVYHLAATEVTERITVIVRPMFVKRRDGNL